MLEQFTSNVLESPAYRYPCHAATLTLRLRSFEYQIGEALFPYCTRHFLTLIKTLSLDAQTDTGNGKIDIEVPDNSHNPEKDLLERERRLSINAAIDSLPEKYRLVIVYRHKDNKSYEEIAEALSIPLGTVKARIFRARELLKKKLRPF